MVFTRNSAVLWSQQAALLVGTPERMAELHFVLAKAYRSLFEPDDAVREMKLALAAAQGGQTKPQLLMEMHQSLATALIEDEDFKGALPMARLALQEIESMKGADTYQALFMLSVIGRSLARLGHPEEGMASFEDMLQRIDRADPPVNPQLIYAARRFYPLALRDVGRIEEGLAAGRENIRMAQAAFGAKSIDLATTMDYHARECETAGRWQESHDHRARSLEIYLTAYGPSNTRPRGASDGLIRMKLKLGLNDEAITARHRFIDLLESAAGPRALEVTKQVKLLIADLRSLGRIEEAKTEITQWRARFEKAKGTYSVAAEPILTAAVEVYEGNEEWQAALDALRDAMAIRKTYLPDAWAIDQAKAQEGFYLTQLNRTAEAIPLIQEGIAGLEKKKGSSPAIESQWLPLAREWLKAAMK